LTHANHGFMNACRSCSEQALCVADVKRVNYTEKRCSDPLRAGIGELTRLHQVGSHRHPAEVVVSIAERHFAN
jgi:hypothetical protein